MQNLKKRGMNFTLVFEAWAHTTKNIFGGGQNDKVYDPLKPYNLHFQFALTLLFA